MIRLRCVSQQYAWGKKGSESVVAQLLQAAQKKAADTSSSSLSSSSFVEIDENKPYAEFWMGTHPNGPSRLAQGQDETLSSWLAQHPEALGSLVEQRWPERKEKDACQLPFLFKVLSIEQALSIQAHPDRALGRILRNTKPQHYPDDNHKPEMALAVTPCEVFCGFRPVAQIALLFRHAPEFASVVGQEHVDRFLAGAAETKPEKEVVKPLFERLMRADPEKIKQGLSQLETRLKERQGASENDEVQKVEHLICRLNQQFPGDVGCFVSYFLNHLHLVPGQAVFLGPNVPHAYLGGNMVECMASSDNTVRAGLTPKFKVSTPFFHQDVDTLVEMLTYKCSEPDWVHPTTKGDAKVYSPPVEEFVVSSLQAGPQRTVVLPPCDSFALVLVYEGEGFLEVSSSGSGVTASKHHVCKGQVYGVAAGHQLGAISMEGHELVLFKANANCERLVSSAL